MWWKLCGVVEDDLQECLTDNTFLTSGLCTEGECFAFLLLLPFFFFVCSAKKLKYVIPFLQSFKARREILFILIGSRSSLNYIYFGIWVPQKSIFFREKIYKPVWNDSITSKISFSFSHCFLVTSSCIYFDHFLCFFNFSKNAKEKEGFKGKCGI